MILLAAFLVAAAFAFLEARPGAYSSRGQWRREASISLALGAVAALIDALLPATPIRSLGAGASLALIVFLADDFLYYVAHRMAHRMGVFWASHAVHHSPVRYNYFTGLRQPPTWLLTPAAAGPVVLLFIGAPAALVAASSTLRGMYHFIIHTERVRRLPMCIEFMFNTPSHHRVHHSTEPGCLDKNFGGVLIIWDRLFGTFAAEPTRGVKRYGLVHPAGAEAWRVALDPWRRLAARVGQAPTIHAKAKALLGPP